LQQPEQASVRYDAPGEFETAVPMKPCNCTVIVVHTRIMLWAWLWGTVMIRNKGEWEVRLG